MQVLFFIMAFANVSAALFFALRYAIRTIHERKAHNSYSHSHEGNFQFSL